MNLRVLTPVCAGFWIFVGTGFPPGDSARAQEAAGLLSGGPGSPASLQTTVVQGAVTQYLMNPDGFVDGLLLANNVLVRFPPHLGQVLAATVRPQDVVRVEGAFESPGTLHATSIIDLQNQRAVGDAPPSRQHPRPPPPGSINRRPLSVQGTIRVLTRARHGGLDGAVLSDGTIIHFPPHAESPFTASLHEGNPLAATGCGTTNEYGRSLEADALGPSLQQLQPIAPRPGQKSTPGGASSSPSQPPP